MVLNSLTVDLDRYLVNPKCKAVDHVGQLDFSKGSGAGGRVSRSER